MESRLRIFLLTVAALWSPFITAADITSPAQSAGTTSAEPLNQIIQQDSVIQPDIKRRQVKEAQIDSENFEVSIFAGLLSIDDFGADTVIGTRLAYHVTEDFFFEGTYAVSKAGTTSYERLSGGVQLLTDDQRSYQYYTVAMGYNLFPGEAFMGRNMAFNNTLYLIAGIGNTEFGGNNHFTTMIGAGYRIILKDWLALHGNVRDHFFNIDITGENKTSHNIEISLGVTYFF